jgi:hypothetical protein
MDRTERQINFLLNQGGPIDIEVDVKSDFEHGLQVLEAVGESRAAALREVTLKGCFSNGDESLRVRQRFARFVNLLELHGREGIRSFTLAQVYLYVESYRMQTGLGDGGTTVFAEHDQARLFGKVLPNLPRLERLRFFQCHGYEMVLSLFVSKLSASASLVELVVDNCNGHCNFSDFVPAIAAMIRRSDVPLQVLKLNIDGLMGKEQYQQIFGSLQHNTTLRRLEVGVREVHDDVRILPPSSSIRTLHIAIGTWTDEAKRILANQLKTNTVLEELRVLQQARTPDHLPWVEMLGSHNYALLVLTEGHARDIHQGRAGVGDERVVAYLRRNERIRGGLDQLRGTYHVSPAALLPRVLHVVRALPTLIYRFVRTGNVDALADLLLARQEQPQNQRSGGPSRRVKEPLKGPAISYDPLET